MVSLLKKSVTLKPTMIEIYTFFVLLWFGSDTLKRSSYCLICAYISVVSTVFVSSLLISLKLTMHLTHEVPKFVGTSKTICHIAFQWLLSTMPYDIVKYRQDVSKHTHMSNSYLSLHSFGNHNGSMSMNILKLRLIYQLLDYNTIKEKSSNYSHL